MAIPQEDSSLASQSLPMQMGRANMRIKKMSNHIDYTNDDYHNSRHSELIGDKVLFEAWSYYAWAKYIQPTMPHKVLEVGVVVGT